MADWVGILVAGGIAYYLITTGTLDQIVQGFIGGGAAAGGGYASGGGYSARSSYKTPSGGYTRGSGSYGGGSPGWYSEGPQGSGHHHCVAYTSGCYCTDPGKCVAQGVPPKAAGQCHPEFGTKEYLGGGPYPSQSQLPQEIAKCPAGTH